MKNCSEKLHQLLINNYYELYFKIKVTRQTSYSIRTQLRIRDQLLLIITLLELMFPVATVSQFFQFRTGAPKSRN